jgi:hypothetical protein
VPKTGEPLTDRELAAGVATAVTENDAKFLATLIAASPWSTGIPSDILDEFIHMILGRPITPTQIRAEAEVVPNVP